MPKPKIGKRYWKAANSPHDCEVHCKHYMEPIEHGPDEPATVCEACLDHNAFELKLEQEVPIMVRRKT